MAAVYTNGNGTDGTTNGNGHVKQQHVRENYGAVDVPLPFNREAENAVIGSLILDRDAIVAISPYLRAEDFHQERCGLVYRAIQTMYERRVPADHVTVINELKNMGVYETVRYSEILQMVLRTPTAAHIRYYAQIVLDCAMRRALISCGGNVAALAYDTGLQVQDVVDRATAMLRSAYERSGGQQEYITMQQAMSAFYDRVEGLDKQNEWQSGVSTGYAGLQRFLRSGLRKGWLTLVCARTAVGKTAMALNLARNVMREGKMVGIFSLEMSYDELLERFVAIEGNVDGTKLQEDGPPLDEFEFQRVQDAMVRVNEWPMLIDDRAGVRMSDLAARATRMHHEHGLELLIVDYLQLMRGSARKESNRVLELGEIANGLKELARQLNVPIVACCQLNREIENRADKTPQLSDIRDSGEIEQAANVALMLYRDEMYNKASARAGIIDVFVRKNRSGPLGTASLRFDDKTTRFYDMEYNRQPPIFGQTQE